MRNISNLLVAAALSAGAPVAAQPDVDLVAQAADRCMVTYAVRLTKTEATDEEIFAAATAGCKTLNDEFDAAVTATFPAEQAAEMKAASAAQAKPNFLQLLQRIRADRASKAGGQ